MTDNKDGQKTPGQPKLVTVRVKKGVVTTNEKKVIQAKYKFSEEEKKDLAAKICQRQLDLVEREDEKKTAMAGYTEKIKVLKMEISTNSRKYRDGYEHRDYACVVVVDYNAREIRYKSIESGKIVETKPFGPGDDQRRWI